MTDLTLLTVSLTKHNAHKIASLLKLYPANQILYHLDEVAAEEAQARKNLSIQPLNVVPEVWAKAKKLGDNAIDSLVLVGIIFSHHDLIVAMINASARSGLSGRIQRDIQLSGKPYTNFVQIVDQLGYATKRNRNGVSFNLRTMFEIPGFGPLVCELLSHKLAAAGWKPQGIISRKMVADESVVQGFHRVFGVPSEEFKDWFVADTQPTSAGTHMPAKDEEFFRREDDSSPDPEPFVFIEGHQKRSVEPISRTASAKSKANQLHNDIQNRLYEYLASQLGPKNVGTEIDTGSGTAIDLATCDGISNITFYEIKTSPSVRTSIRQAIPQLLEYAYWPSVERANKLVVVSHLPITNEAEVYLQQLREQFGLPLFYQQFDMTANTLVPLTGRPKSDSCQAASRNVQRQ